MLIDYEVLRLIWWLLLGVLLIGFAIMDGFDLGVATLLPFVAKNEEEKQVLLHTIEPYWEGNQVWLLLGGGAIFAAWPAVYAVSFSSLYLALCLLLLALGLRPVSFAFRNKLENSKWRKLWEITHFLSGILPAILCGVAVGNAVQGLPFKIDDSDMSIYYYGSFWELLNPYALLIGLMSLAMLLMQGSIYLALKTTDSINDRSKTIAKHSILTLIVLYIVGGVATFYINGYEIISDVVLDGPSNPLYKEVALSQGLWMQNFIKYPYFMAVPALVILGSILAYVLVSKNLFGRAFIASSTAIFGVVSTAGVCMFPFILPSSYNLKSSLTIWDSSSSALTLQIMLIVALIFVPIVLAYTSWVFKVLKGKINYNNIKEHY